MARIIKYELTDSGWKNKTVKVVRSLKTAKGEADKLNNARDDEEVTAMVSFIALD